MVVTGVAQSTGVMRPIRAAARYARVVIATPATIATAMDLHVFTGRHDLQIVGSVLIAILIAMVNLLLWQQRASQLLFHHVPMLPLLSSVWVMDEYVPMRRVAIFPEGMSSASDRIGILRDMVAGARTILRGFRATSTNRIGATASLAHKDDRMSILTGHRSTPSVSRLGLLTQRRGIAIHPSQYSVYGFPVQETGRVA